MTLSLEDGDTFEYCSCGEQFTTEDVAAVVNAAAKWAKVLDWVNKCPARHEGQEAVA